MARLRLCLLGAPRLEWDGRPVDIGLRKALALLVYLAVTGQSHTRDALATLLWPDRSQTEGRARLRQALHRLQRHLDPQSFRTDSATIGLAPHAGLWLDSAAFTLQIGVALPPDRSLADIQTVDLAPVEAAVALYRDDFLAGFSLPDSPEFDEWQFFQREQLRKLFARALEYLARAHHRHADHEAALGYARRWLALDPLHEPSHRQLMRLYAQAGQHAAALRQYQVCARLLEEELGVAPEPETQELYAAIRARQLPSLTQADGQPAVADPAVAPQPAAITSASRAAAHVGVSPLPLPLTQLIGRNAELARLHSFLMHPGIRLVTLTGPGGVGKTRLALEVAREAVQRFPDGIVFVPLAGLDTPRLVLPTLARALGLLEAEGQPLLARLQTLLARQRLLLVLDNFEHLADAAPQLAELLAGTMHLTLLVTSRVTLRLRGEQEYPINPLELPDLERSASREQLLRNPAVQLFVARMHAAQPELALSEERVAAVAALCRHLDGLPLALELAAARVRVLAPEALLARLERRLPLLSSRDRDLPTRHRTLRDTIAWSYDLLDEAGQQLFCRLAVFVEGATLEAIGAIYEFHDSVDLLEGVTALVENSLLRQDTTAGQPRFGMLETVREYALERLEERGELAMARQRHAHYYAEQLTRRAGVKVYSAEASSWLDWFERERENIRAVLSYSQTAAEGTALGPALIGNLLWFWYRRGYFHEGRWWSEQVLASPAAADDKGRALALHGSALLALWQGDLHIAHARAEERLALARRLEDPSALATALMNLGTILVNMGRDEEAYRLLREAQPLCREAGHAYFYAITLVHLGNATLGLGELTEARSWLAEAAAIGHDIGEPWLLAFALNNLGEVARVAGSYDQARRYYEESEALLRSSGDKGDLARSWHSLGFVAQAMGDLTEAEAHFQASLELFLKLGNRRGIAECVAGLGGVLLRQGQRSIGCALLAAAERALQTSGANWWPADRREHERSKAIDPEAFVAALQDREQMTLEQAIRTCCERVNSAAADFLSDVVG
jgi:predicted ATPase/DNA-binding SARP family transcriptional activator